MARWVKDLMASGLQPSEFRLAPWCTHYWRPAICHAASDRNFQSYQETLEM